MKRLLALGLMILPICTPAWSAEDVKAKTVYDVTVEPMADDKETSVSLAQYKGDVLLIVNVASKCGYTPQYEGLEMLNEKYSAKGLRVLGFPCNDFGKQEPGSEEEIVQFCKKNYGATFPLYAKVHAIGEEKSPIYRFLTEAVDSEEAEVKWNFEKFLISREGKVVGRFRSAVKPESEELTVAIEKELEQD